MTSIALANYLRKLLQTLIREENNLLGHGAEKNAIRRSEIWSIPQIVQA
jgi:hypothetical protein